MINIDILRTKRDDELHDAEEYRKMAEECPDFHQIFCDIAHEEESHARLLEHVMMHKS